MKQKSNSLVIPLEPTGPISLKCLERIKVTIQSYWIVNKVLQSETHSLQNKTSKSSMNADGRRLH